MEKRKRNRRSKKREQIIRTAESLFSRFGAKRVTVEEICREAGVSKMTFYKYFPNKVELVLSIRDEWVEEGFRKFDEINAKDIPFPEKINLMTRWKVEFASRINAEFIRELASTDDIIEQVKRRYLNNITDAQKKGKFVLISILNSSGWSWRNWATWSRRRAGRVCFPNSASINSSSGPCSGMGFSPERRAKDDNS